MKLYLLRHGRTAWNAAGKLQGRTDIPLNEEGRRAARETGEMLAAVPFAAAFSSPLRRAVETAELILRGRDLPVRTDARLIELSFGSAEGKRLADLNLPEDPIRVLFSAPERYVPPEGGERYDRLLARCRSFLEEELLPHEKEWEHVLLVAHGGVVRGMFSAMFGRDAGRLYGGRVQKNCAVNVIGCTGGTFSLEKGAGAYCDGL